VLDVNCPGISLDGLTRARLIEHQVVEGDHIPFITLKILHFRPQPLAVVPLIAGKPLVMFVS
jgi:hypothetical protein